MLYLNPRVMEEVSSFLDELLYNEDKEKFPISKLLKIKITVAWSRRQSCTTCGS